jgi:hypothetical protein
LGNGDDVCCPDDGLVCVVVKICHVFDVRSHGQVLCGVVHVWMAVGVVRRGGRVAVVVGVVTIFWDIWQLARLPCNGNGVCKLLECIHLAC